MNGSTLVIGYGNPLCGDDGAGPYVARQLGDGAIACRQLTPELAEPVSRARRVIFVDAHAGVPPGEIDIQPVGVNARGATHRWDPETLRAYAEQVYGASPEALLIGIGAESFDLGQGLSPAALRAASTALCEIRRLVAMGRWVFSPSKPR